MSGAAWSPATRAPHEWDPAKFTTYGRGLLSLSSLPSAFRDPHSLSSFFPPNRLTGATVILNSALSGPLEGTLDPELLAKPIVLTQPEPWKMVQSRFPDETIVHIVSDIDHELTKARTEGWRNCGASCVVGLGGGMALDHAKFCSWDLELPLILVPSILSVDAGYTRAIGVREGDRVKYVGDASGSLRHIFVDYNLLQAAPPILNSAGAGDILSCFTALWDWERASIELKEDFDAGVAEHIRSACLERLYSDASELAAQTEKGLHTLSELFIEEVRACEKWGNARLEEGSEHYIGYALEATTGKHYIHGQLIGMCILLAAVYQGQDITRVVRCLKDMSVDCSFTAVKTSREEVRHVLLRMDKYVAQESQLLPGVFHFKGAPSESEADSMLDAVDKHFPPQNP